MEIFYNLEQPGYDEIVSYGPKWWTEYKEMDANYKYAGWTLDLMASLLERIVKNQFPSQADEKAVGIFEKLLKIEYDDTLSLEERRKIVSAYYSGTGHLSRSVILGMVKTYTEKDGEVFWDGNTLCICFNSDKSVIPISLGMLQKIIKRRIPAHIPFQTRVVCSVQVCLGINREVWKVSYTLTGTEPKISTGLMIASPDVEISETSEIFKNKYPMTGDSGSAGTFPVTSTGLFMQDEGIQVTANATGYSIEYGLAGDGTESGIKPIISNGLGVEENSVLPSVKTEKWQIEYQLCGDDYGL